MIVPETVNFMLCSHVSKEPAGRKMLESMGLKAMLDGELCLGEGTGGAMLIPFAGWSFICLSFCTQVR